MAIYDIHINEDGSIDLGTITPASIGKYFQYAVIREIHVDYEGLRDREEGLLATIKGSVIIPNKMFKIEVYKNFNKEYLIKQIETIKALLKNDKHIVEGIIYDKTILLIIGIYYDIDIICNKMGKNYSTIDSYTKMAYMAEYFNIAIIWSEGYKNRRLGNEEILIKADYDVLIDPDSVYKIELYEHIEKNFVLKQAERIKKIIDDGPQIVGYCYFNNKLVIYEGCNYEYFLENFKGMEFAEYYHIH